MPFATLSGAAFNHDSQDVVPYVWDEVGAILPDCYRLELDKAKKVGDKDKIAAIRARKKQVQSSPSACDLVRTTPTNLRIDASGNRVIARVLPSDIRGYNSSSAIWGYYLPMALLSAIALILFALVHFFGAYVPKNLHRAAEVYNQAAGIGDSARSAFWLCYRAAVYTSLIPLLPFAGACWYAFLVLMEQEPTRTVRNTCLAAFGCVSLFIVGVPTFGPVLGAILSLAGIFFMPLLAYSDLSIRDEEARKATEATKTDSMNRDFVRCMEGLRGQQENALRDGSRLMVLGFSKGILREEGDEFTPDSPTGDSVVGGPLCISCGEDLSSSLMYYGAPKTGKTSRGLIPMGMQNMYLTRGAASLNIPIDAENIKIKLKNKTLSPSHQLPLIPRILDGGGMIVFDHKDDLQKIFFRLAEKHGFLLIDPVRYHLNMIGPLTDELSVTQISLVAAPSAAAKGDIWTKACEVEMRYALMLLSFMKRFHPALGKKALDGKDLPRLHFPLAERSLYGLAKFLTDEIYRHELLSELWDGHMEAIAKYKSLSLAYDYFAVQVPKMPEATKGSVRFTIIAFFSELVGNEGLRKWTGEKSDINISSAVAHGASIGISCPDNLYGMGANLAVSLIRNSVYEYVKPRDSTESAHFAKTMAANDSNFNERFVSENDSPEVTEAVYKFNEANKAGELDEFYEPYNTTKSSPTWRADGETNVLVIMDEFGGMAEKSDNIVSIGRSLGLRVITALQSKEQLIARLGSEHAANQIESCFVGGMIMFRTATEMTANTVYTGNRVTNIVKPRFPSLAMSLEADQSNGIFDKAQGEVIRRIRTYTAILTDKKRSFSLDRHDHGAGRDTVADLNVLKNYNQEFVPSIPKERMNQELKQFGTAYISVIRAGYPLTEICYMPTWPELEAWMNRAANPRAVLTLINGAKNARPLSADEENSMRKLNGLPPLKIAA